MRLGCAGVTWRQFNSEERVVLSEIARAGFEGTPWKPTEGARDKAPAEAAAQLREKYDSYGLEPAPGWIWADLWDNGNLEEVRWCAAVSRELGLPTVAISAGGFDLVMQSGRRRDQIPGRVEARDMMTLDQQAAFMDNLHQAGKVALEEGVRLAYHPHVGTVVESPEEVQWFLSNTDPEVIFLCADTGHLAWGGNDVVQFFEENASRVEVWHAKDVDAMVAREARDKGWNYDQCERFGVFTEIGRGSVDFASVIRSLDQAGFTGWAISETDYTQLPTALESAFECRRALRALGVGSES